ncbi:sensor domain-containing diguanylate cyclase [Cohnella sp. REN36]|uniref:sensor domain-containing diguanylate cyclase n=1 Tax=Cohnella sp. REN36 TaxID=2887347 RepID=UPI001D13F375|nr:sensor domain-containing diguanylate cyclase [Cohnella sp. REN36]MCC3374852.1 sensor domain-containing diguanylate cyclase [Cohnella sp. REN36]
MGKRSADKKGIKLSVIISAVVFLSIAITYALNTVVGYETQKRSLSNNTLELNQITANELSRTTQTIVLSMKETMKTAADYFSVPRNRLEDVQGQLDFLRNSVPYFNSVVLVDNTGLVVSTSPETLSLVGQKLKSDQAQQALKLRKPLISAPYQAITKRLIVLVSYPIFGKDGTYVGFIGGSIYLQEPNVFQKVLGEQSRNKNGSYYYVVDASGNLIYHPDLTRVGERPTSNPVVQEIIAGKGGQMQVTNTKGIRYLAGYSIVPAVGWGIVSQTPLANVSTSVSEIAARMAVISIPILILILLIVVWLSHRLALPLNRLAHVASVFNRGEAVTVQIPQAKHWTYEANELYKAVSEAFRMMGTRADELTDQAHTDPLTGLANRRFLDTVVAHWVEQKTPFAIVMLDLDRFKSINDTFGHQQGDEVLRFLAERIRGEKRDIDYGCRYGGEEFTLLLPYADKEIAFLIAERIRLRMAEEDSPIGRPVTLSLGISSYPHDANDAASLFKQADDALYEAKETGRNRTVVYRPDRRQRD